MPSSIKIKRVILIVLIILNCSTIFYFSNQVADDSSAESSRFVEFISEVLPSIKNMQEPDKTNLKENILTPIVRKTAHLSIYTLLGILTYSLSLTYDVETKKRILYSLLFCICYAMTDELHQIFVDGRSGEIRDILIDFIGASIGIIIIQCIKNIKGKIERKNNSNGWKSRYTTCNI